MDVNLFFGRFHVVLVHLPIGLLLLAVVMYFFSRKKGFENLDGAIGFTLFFGMLSAALAAFCGWLLANTSGYDDNTLFFHRWLGIGVAVLSAFCWLLKTERVMISHKVFPGLLTILALMIIFTGHFGANLTHGEGYLLKYAPSILKSVFDSKSSTDTTAFQFSNPDSTFIFDDLLLPVLKEKCGDCHNEKKKKGGLVLTTKEGFLEGGEHDEIFHFSNASESEIFIRVTLPVGDEKFMPPKGQGLSYDQIRLLEWWINEGAAFEKAVSDYDFSKDMEQLLAKSYGLEIKEKSFVETIKVAPLPESVFKNIEAQKFKITRLAKDNNLVEINLQPGVKTITIDQLEKLLEAKEQITWLNLGNSDINDAHLVVVKDLSNLTRLRLELTKITDQGLALLIQLPHLESLNLYGTSISDQSVDSFIKMATLKTIYLWQTNISPEGLEKLRTQRPKLEIVTGLEVSKEH